MKIKVEYFDIKQTFDCGQCFRFDIMGNCVRGFAFGKELNITQLSENEIELDCTESDYENIWKSYLGLDMDYNYIRSEMSKLRPTDEKLAAAMDFGKGIRLLRQDPWETLCSFIISQNNNIPRIKKLISALCRAGAELENNSSENIFPKPETLLKLGEDGLFALKTGFRAGYLYDAALKVSTGEVDLNAIYSMSLADAEAELCKIKGVGPKVAACTLLFGFAKFDAFPVDVWVKRVISEYYSGNIAPTDFGPFAGLAQQYLFYHKRYLTSL